MKNSPLIVVLFFVLLTRVYAQDNPDTLDVYTLSLEDLMNIRVTTASKSSESIKDAPGIISIITRDEIANFGSVSLYEILDRITSTIVVSTTVAPNGMVSMRGKQTDHFNTNILILLDGRPFRESFQGGYNGVLYSIFPIQSIERIEVIRGPGSVLYGTNAYMGVINIITKSIDRDLTVSTRYGSFNTIQGQVSVGRKINEFDFRVDANMIDSDGWDFIATDEVNVSDSTKYYEKGLGVHSSIGFKGLRINSFYGHSEMNGMGRITAWTVPSDYTITNRRLFADAGYTYEFNKAWSATLNCTYNRMNFTNSRPGYKDNLTYRFASDILIELVTYYKPTRKLNVLLGGLSNIQTGEAKQPEISAPAGFAFDISNAINPNPFIVVEPYKEIWFSAYLQADYTLLKWFKLVGGGQLNKVEDQNLDFVPRIGGIFTMTKAWSSKILYGSAFRSATPGFEKRALSPPSVAGYKGLEPEKVSTFEASVIFSKSKFEASVTYYNMEERNIIARSASSEGLAQTMYRGSLINLQRYINRGSLSTNGIEIEGKSFLGKGFSIIGSFSYNKAVDDLGKEDYQGMPKMMIKTGLSYQSNGVGLSVFNSYFGVGGDAFLYNTDGSIRTRIVNPEATSYNYMTINMSWDFNTLLQLKKGPDVLLNLYIKNALDQDIYYPEVVRRNINSLPGRPGRSLYASLTIGL